MQSISYSSFLLCVLMSAFPQPEATGTDLNSASNSEQQWRIQSIGLPFATSAAVTMIIIEVVSSI